MLIEVGSCKIERELGRGGMELRGLDWRFRIEANELPAGNERERRTGRYVEDITVGEPQAVFVLEKRQ